MKNILRTIISVCTSAILLFSILLSVGIIAKNNELKYQTKNNSSASTQSGSVIGGQIEIDQSSQYSKVYYASETSNTGVDNAEDGTKGGAVYLEDLTDEQIANGEVTNMSMNGSILSGFSAVYGGAIYVGNGAICTLTDGKITNNIATYGGAVYVAKGGKFIMNGGSISYNTTSKYGAIYVEAGGIIELNGGVVIEGNQLQISDYIISEDTIDGFHYMEYGTYPQTFVGSELNDELETWYNDNSPTKIKTYTTDTSTWDSYEYTDGNIYVRGINNPRSYYYSDSDFYTFKNGDILEFHVVWFKLEPIVWLITNYNEIIEGIDKTIKCLSFICLTADVALNISTDDPYSWDSSNLKSWLNVDFFSTAFTNNEQARISNTIISTNEDDYIQSVYLLNSNEIELLMPTKASRLCSPSDFTISNYGSLFIDIGYPTLYRLKGGTTWWRTFDGAVSDGGTIAYAGVSDKAVSIRPVIQIMI